MLTVLIATHNRANTLTRVLDSFCLITPPPGGWGVVVVDNASNDRSREILESYTNRLPLRVISEPRRGKNRALNTGLEFVEGDLVVFTDDDVIPERDWLIKLRRAADEQPRYSMFGGRIEAIWPYEPAEWIFRLVPLDSTYTVTPADLEDGPCSPSLIWGPNMAVRRSIFDAGHRFDESIGPQPGQYRMGGETEFTIRLSNLGYSAWHCRASRVGHIIRPEQMDPKWIIKRAYRAGRDTYRRTHGLTDSTPSELRKFFGVPRWILRSGIEQITRLATAKIKGDREESFCAKMEIESLRGFAYAARVIHKAARRQLRKASDHH